MEITDEIRLEFSRLLEAAFATDGRLDLRALEAAAIRWLVDQAYDRGRKDAQVEPLGRPPQAP